MNLPLLRSELVDHIGDTLRQESKSAISHMRPLAKSKPSPLLRFSLFKTVFMSEYGPRDDMDEIGDHPDEEKDVEAIINGQLASALLDTERANSHCGVLETLADYTSLGVQDDTPKVLRLFTDKLPVKGQIMGSAHNLLLPPPYARKTEEDIVSLVSASSSEIERPDPLLLGIESYVDDSKLRRDCLLRDCGQCVVTKWFDKDWEEKKFSGQMMPQGWEDRPDTIDQIGNGFMMGATVHGDFGDFEFDFEQQHGSNTTYNIRWFCAWNPAIGLFKNYPEVVEFASIDPGVTELPDPVFLDVHYRVGDILNGWLFIGAASQAIRVQAKGASEGLGGWEATFPSREE
ncbi:hypothetical protein CSAL01_02304 [Colletotrichum salicis]|uniref:HNH nuclease domain-containing protein n=1 Tax=Colletotrichum salicis TaxID=1209931 RepID=A0A135V2P4_9PEZI|nr:hypothetical protein CSAL01_02304 [Colletotrichum salicis]